MSGSAEWRKKEFFFSFLSLYSIPQQSWRGKVYRSSDQGYPWVEMVKERQYQLQDLAFLGTHCGSHLLISTCAIISFFSTC